MNGNRTCSRCRRGGFNLKIGFSKPMFECTLCGAGWCYGYDGGNYFRHAMNVGDTTPLDWVEAKDLTRAALEQERT